MSVRGRDIRPKQDDLINKMKVCAEKTKTSFLFFQAWIAQLVAYRLGNGEVPGSNPGKGENFSVKISNWVVNQPWWLSGIMNSKFK